MITRHFHRSRRLELIIERLNKIHCTRRLHGRRTDHLHSRSRSLSRAFLDAREAELKTPLP